MKKIKVGILILVAIVIVAGVVGCLFSMKQGAQIADEKDGRFLLRNIAIAEQTYSAVHGGGGQHTFTGNAGELAKFAASQVIDAIREKGKNEKALGGYYMVISENPKDDAFKSDYAATVYPVEGFAGKIMRISKDEKIIITGEQK